MIKLASTEEIVRDAAEGMPSMRRRGRPPKLLSSEEGLGPLSKKTIRTIDDVQTAKMYADAFGVKPEDLIGKKIKLVGDGEEDLDFEDLIRVMKQKAILKYWTEEAQGHSSSNITEEGVARIVANMMAEHEKGETEQDFRKEMLNRFDRLEHGEGGAGLKKGFSHEDVENLMNTKLKDLEIKRLEEDKRNIEREMSSTNKSDPQMQFLQTQLNKTIEKLDSLSQDKFIRDVADTMQDRFGPVQDKLKDLEAKLGKIPEGERRGILEKAMAGTEEVLASELGKIILGRIKGESDLVSKDEKGQFQVNVNEAINRVIDLFKTALEKIPATGTAPPQYRPPTIPEKTGETTPPPPPPQKIEKTGETGETGGLPLSVDAGGVGKTEAIKVETPQSSNEAGNTGSSTKSAPGKLEADTRGS